MKRKDLVFFLLIIPSLACGQIIADHNIVDRFDDIPRFYIDEVKKMFVTFPGESHSQAYRTGLLLLEQSRTELAVSVVEAGTPEPYTDRNLRFSRATWGDINNPTGWIYNYGEEDIWLTQVAKDRTKAGITYCNTHGLSLAAWGFAQCSDPDIDIQDYIVAMQELIDYCTANSYSTKIIFTTGTVDDWEPEIYGYYKSLRNIAIRNYVALDESRILFDYADILCFNDDGTTNSATFQGNVFPIITDTNLGNADLGHIGPAGALRLGKAMWWMLARIAGWDGRIEPVPVSSVTISGSGGATSMSVGGTLPLSASVLPADATDKSVTWSVTNGTGQATVSSAGLVTALAGGTVTVKATSNDGTGVFGELDLTISNLAFTGFPAAGITGISLAPFRVEMRRNGNTVDNSFTGNITLTNATGTGDLSGTLTVAAINGIAFFGDVRFDRPGSYTLYASAGTIPRTESSTVAISSASVGDFCSNVSGNWGTAGSWIMFNGSAWIGATESPNRANANKITVRSGHTVIITSNITIDQVVVETGGQINLTSSLTVADGAGDDLVVNGTLYRSAGTINTTGNLVFGAGANYYHVINGGAIPTASWNAESTCLVTGNITGALAVSDNQTFGNFIWNCLQTESLSISPSGMSVAGDLIIAGTGSNNFAIEQDITVGGDLIINGSQSIYRLCHTQNRTQTINGNVTLSGGGILVLNTNGPPTGTGILYVKGDLSFAEGTIRDNTAGGSGTIVFCGTTRQSCTSGGTVSGPVDFIVAAGAFLQMAGENTIIGGTGSFTLSDGATLGITSPDGISATAASGNIQCSGTRAFHTGAGYIYNGSSPQVTGSGLPSTLSNLTFDNNGGAVTFTGPSVVTNNFSITTGSRANPGAFTSLRAGALILGGSAQNGCTYGSTSSSAVFKNNIYFTAGSTGIITTGTGTDCIVTGQWIGGTSSDWNESSNWYGSYRPVSTTNVTITSAAAHQPVVSDSHPPAGPGDPPVAVIGNLTIGAGAMLTINAGQALTARNLFSSGTLNLKSDATGIASLIIDSYNDNGTENIELYLTGGGDETNYAWHYISSPVQGLPTGIFTGTANDLVRYVESLPVSQPPYSTRRGWIGFDGWNYYSDEGQPYNESFSFDENGPRPNGLRLGQGYNYWHDLDDDPDNDPVTYTFSGQINTSEVAPVLSYSGIDNNYSGYNLLGNPFTCGLSWDGITGSGSFPANMSTSLWFTSHNEFYTYQSGIGVPSGTTGHIPPMQGFFVKTNEGFVSGTTLPIPLSAREHNPTARYKGDGVPVSLVRLAFDENGKSFETVVRFDDNAKSGSDLNFDAPVMFMPGDRPSICTTSGGTGLTINGLPFPETSVEVPVNLNLVKEGSHAIRAEELKELDGFSIILTDKLTDAGVDLKTVKEYTFQASPGLIKDRFVLTVSRLRGPTDPTGPEELINIYYGFDNINIMPLSDEWDGATGSVRITDLTGRVVIHRRNTEFRKNTLIRIPFSGVKGIYLVEIASKLSRTTGKVLVK